MVFRIMAFEVCPASLELFTERQNLKPGEESILNVMIKDSPLIYGVEISLGFDPKMIEMIDADNNQPGIQSKPGDFLDPNRGFFIQNFSDNKKGKVNYMYTLLNPAPATRGKGLLFSTGFRALQPGKGVFKILIGKLGTPEGKTLSVQGKPVEILIKDSMIINKAGLEQSPKGSNYLIYILIGALCVMTLILVVVLKSKSAGIPLGSSDE